MRSQILTKISNQESYFLINSFIKKCKASLLTVDQLSAYWTRTLRYSSLSEVIQQKLICPARGISQYLDCFTQDIGFLGAYVNFVLDESIDFLERLIEYASLCDLNFSDKEVADQLLVLFSLSLNSKLIPEFKYWANLVFCKHFRLAELPACSGVMGEYLVFRRLRVFLNRLRSKQRYLKDYPVQLIYTAFQGLKKGFMPGRPDMIDSSLLKHHKNLCTKDGSCSEEVADICERTASDIFDRVKLDRNDKPYTKNGIKETFSNMNLFSRNSTMESNYLNGGLLGQLAYDASQQIRAIITPELVAMVENNCGVVSVYSNGYHFSELASQRDGPQNAFSTNPSAQPYCIIEPMKIRIITKPSVYQHFGLKAVQKDLWTRLYSHKTGIFSLVGSTIDECQVARTLASWRPGRKFCSGDYSGATDNLKSEVTKHIWKAIECGSDPFTALWAWRSLMPSDILYERCHPEYLNVLDNWKYEYQKLGTQEMCNGQLMGSILSFIILCVANLAAFRLAAEKYYKKLFSLEELSEEFGVCVNGDDILFTATDEFYWYWRNTIGDFGFEPSVGKNLFSDDVFQINSALFVPRYSVVDGEFRCLSATWVPYVNFGLITTRKKQDCSKTTNVWAAKWEGYTPEMLEGLNRLKVLKKVQTDLLDGLHPKLRSGSNQLFWEFSKYLKKAFPLVPFFECEEWGGIGLQNDGITIDESDSIRQYQTGPVKDQFFRARNLTKGDKILKEKFASQYPQAILMGEEIDPQEEYGKYVRKFCKVQLPLYCREQAISEYTGIQLRTYKYPIVCTTEDQSVPRRKVLSTSGEEFECNGGQAMEPEVTPFVREDNSEEIADTLRRLRLNNATLRNFFAWKKSENDRYIRYDQIKATDYWEYVRIVNDFCETNYDSTLSAY